ncbi:MAG: tetratricopeptide repeat protein [Bacteroidia bacterium]
MRIAQELQDDRGTMIALNNIGLIKLSLEKPEEAMKEVLQCKALAEKLRDSMRTSTILNNIGTALKRLNRDEEALAKFRESIVWAEATGNEEQIVDDLINIGSIQVVRHEYDSALVNFQRAGTLAEELEYSIAKPEVLEGISSAYSGLGKMDLALQYAQACLDSARALDMTEQIIGGLDQLAEIQEKMGLYREADLSLKEFIHLKDSFFNASKTIEFGQLEQSFDYERKELQQQIADQEKKAELREANIRQYIISFGVVSVIALLMIVGLRYSRKRRLRYFVVFAALLVFFEFALVLLDNFVDGFTGGLPIPKLLANVLLAALIAPLNTVLERKLVEARGEQNSRNAPNSPSS